MNKSQTSFAYRPRCGRALLLGALALSLFAVAPSARAQNGATYTLTFDSTTGQLVNISNPNPFSQYPGNSPRMVTIFQGGQLVLNVDSIPSDPANIELGITDFTASSGGTGFVSVQCPIYGTATCEYGTLIPGALPSQTLHPQYRMTFSDAGVYTLAVGHGGKPQVTFKVSVLPALGGTMNWAGDYDSHVLYPLGSVVTTGYSSAPDWWLETFTGGSSMIPGQSPDWIHIGGAGAQGPKGDTGANGPAGPAGATGPAGSGFVTGCVIQLSASTPAPAGFVLLGSGTICYQDGSKHKSIAVKYYIKQ